MTKTLRLFILILVLTVVATFIALPDSLTIMGQAIKTPVISFSLFGRQWTNRIPLKEGLDIRGGMEVVLKADMSAIPEADRPTALAAAREVIARRVDLFGINEPVIQTTQQGQDYRVAVELAGVDNPDEALQLVGRTAQLEFKLEATPSAQATESALLLNNFTSTGLTGKDLKRASVQFDQKTGEPIIALEFNDHGRQLFGDITSKHVGEVLAIFIDEFPIALPRINTPILDGQAVMTGGFTLDQAKQLAIQLNAGALPVPITVLEQHTIGATLGQQSIQASVKAGLIGVLLVMVFMILMYGWKGVLATIALAIYAVITVALYKLMGVTLTLPGIAGLLLSVGMAVDSNILIFERMKEELRTGKTVGQAMELGFTRAWNSIKDANVTTIVTSLILINPLDIPFLNTSGLVRGFGVTLLMGVMISLFTGIVVTRTLMRLFLKGSR